MRSTKQLSVTLPIEMAEMVKGKVESGEYASESEVIRDGLRAMQMRDRALEDWLRSEVVSTLRAMKDDPSSSRNAEQVRDSLREAYRVARKAG